MTNRYLDLATGRMYAQKRFGEKERQHVRDIERVTGTHRLNCNKGYTYIFFIFSFLCHALNLPRKVHATRHLIV